MLESSLELDESQQPFQPGSDEKARNPKRPPRRGDTTNITSKKKARYLGVPAGAASKNDLDRASHIIEADLAALTSQDQSELNTFNRVHFKNETEEASSQLSVSDCEQPPEIFEEGEEQKHAPILVVT